jgi:hypothetical protein
MSPASWMIWIVACYWAYLGGWAWERERKYHADRR